MKRAKKVFGLLALILILLLISPAEAGKVTLTWDPNSESDLAGYKIYYGTSSGNYEWYMDVGNLTEYVLRYLTIGTTYYIAATAYNTHELESGFSNEVIYTVPNPPVTYAVSVNVEGAGSGSVSSYPEGLSCTSSLISCSTNYGIGTVLTLTATPDEGSTFVSWSGGGCIGSGTCSFSVNSNLVVTATFQLSPQGEEIYRALYNPITNDIKVQTLVENEVISEETYFLEGFKVIAFKRNPDETGTLMMYNATARTTRFQQTDASWNFTDLYKDYTSSSGVWVPTGYGLFRNITTNVTRLWYMDSSYNIIGYKDFAADPVGQIVGYSKKADGINATLLLYDGISTTKKTTLKDLDSNDNYIGTFKQFTSSSSIWKPAGICPGKLSWNNETYGIIRDWDLNPDNSYAGTFTDYVSNGFLVVGCSD